jgi:hypothetical protein
MTIHGGRAEIVHARQGTRLALHPVPHSASHSTKSLHGRMSVIHASGLSPARAANQPRGAGPHDYVCGRSSVAVPSPGNEVQTCSDAELLWQDGLPSYVVIETKAA